jgi:hypothetical protein
MAEVLMSANVQEVRRYRINPVELLILTTIGGVFLNSVYHLLYDPREFRQVALQEMAANPISEGRSPASVTSAFQTTDIPCSSVLERSTSAAKIRLFGSFCSGSEGASGNSGILGPTTVSSTIDFKSDSLVRSAITNETNRFNATIFADESAGKYSTDYIPLAPGKNKVKLEFAYKSGKVVTQEIEFSKL